MAVWPTQRLKHPKSTPNLSRCCKRKNRGQKGDQIYYGFETLVSEWREAHTAPREQTLLSLDKKHTHSTVFIHYEDGTPLHLHEGYYSGSDLLQNYFQRLLLFKNQAGKIKKHLGKRYFVKF